MDKSIENILNTVEKSESGKHKKKKKAKGGNKKRADHKHEYVIIPYSITDSSYPCVDYAKVCRHCGYINNVYISAFKDIEKISKEIPVIRSGKIYYGKFSDKFLPNFKKGMFESEVSVLENNFS